MNQFLQKSCRINLSLIFLALLMTHRVVATPTPTCPIVTERFQGLGDGTTVNNSSTGWYLNASNVAGTGYFAVKSNRFHAQELGGEGIWYSKVFSVSGYTDFQVALKISSEGDMNSSEYVKVYYKINGGPETLYDSRTGNFGTIDFISPNLNGNNVQLIVKLYNYNNGGSQTSKYYIEEYRVFKEHGPCASSISVSATAGNGGVLTCANPSLTLSAGTTASGTTTWSWTGPNSFTSTSQNPSINTPGTYTVVGTNAAGSGSASVIVSENKVPPVVTATGGALACANSITINATSSVAGSLFSWTGPGDFTSTTQNPSVSTPGTYNVTVTNPSNGCTASQSVTVTAGSAAPVTIWEQVFSCPNGTTSFNPPNAWTSSVPSGNFSVQNSEFYINNNGASVEGVWTSESFSITGKTNVTISAGVRSGVASGGALESSGSSLDYVRLYYKLNNGTEVLFQEYLGTINGNSAVNTTVSVGSLSGSTLQVIIRARTTSSDERYYFDNVFVTGVPVTTGATITPSVSGTVTCSNTVQLSATVSGGTASAYSWTGPNGFTSSLQNPVINAGGQYIVTATLSTGGCSVSAPITVAENKTAPDITASGGTLACLSSITLNASSSVSGVTYSWTGPGSFTSTSRNPVVSITGTYTATVMNPANGCTASQQVTVTSGITAATTFWLENFTLTDGAISDSGSTAWSAITTGAGTYSVQNNEFKTSFSSGAEGVWTSQAIDISGKSNVSFSVNLRSETASTNDAFESDDYIRVYYKLNGGAEILVYDDAAGIGSTTTGTASSTAAASSLNGSTLQIIIKTRNSGTSEKYFFDNVSLTGADKISENVTATAQGVLTCTTTMINLSGSSTASGLSYSWAGPNGFTSTLQNPTTGVAGVYTLTVTNPSTGCTGTDTALVNANTTAPAVSVSASGAISCSINSVTVSAASSAAGATYSWTGPNSFTSSLQSPVVNTIGTYNVTATDPANGCTGTASVPVTFSNTTTGTLWLEDFALPNGTAADAGTTIWSVSINPSTTLFTVNNNEFRVSNSTTTGEGVWTSGAIDITGKTNVNISALVRSAITGSAVMNTTGEFADYIRFYYKLNGGAEVLFAEKIGTINSHSTTPAAISIGSLSGTNLQIIVRARATGNDEFYYFDDVKVVGTGQSNVNAVASGASTLTCTTTSVALSGSSSAPGAAYSWTGPNGFTSVQQNPNVTAPGDYILTVTSGGCTAADTVTVIQNTTLPANVDITSSTNSNQINCLVGGMTLTASSSTAGAVFSWSTPNFTGNGSVVTATTPGNYIVTATNPASGCIAKDTFVVITNYATPLNGLITPGSASLTCINTSVTLTGSNTLPGVTFKWVTGTGVFIADGPVLTVSQPGYYNLVMNHPVTGCNHTIGAEVVQVTAPPGNVAITTSSVNNEINCTFNSVTLRGNSSTSGTTYGWTGPNGYVATGIDATVTTPGEYILTATNPASGCSVTTSTTVTRNDTQPANVSASPVTNGGQLTCIHTSINLAGSSSTVGVNYSWSGPNNYSAMGTSVAVIDSGKYTLTVTDPANGCGDTSVVTVTQNKSQPSGVSATHTDVLTCLTTSIELTGNSSTPGASFLWTSPNGFTAATRNTETSLPGTYFLKVTNPANGCFRTVFTVVEQDIAPPADVTATNSGPLTCTTTSVNLTGSTSASDVDYIWTGPGGFVSFLPFTTTSVPGIYTLTVTDLATNGCSDTVTTTVIEDLTGCGLLAVSRNSPVLAAPPVESTEKPVTVFEHKTYPNPFSDRVFIEFRSPGNDLVTVGIFSGTSPARTIFNDKIKAGQTYKLVLNAGNLPAGIHYCIIKVNGKIYSHKLLLIK